MPLDPATLTLAGGVVTLASGIFLLGYWWHHRGERASLWGAVGNCGDGIGITLLSFNAVVPFFVANILAPIILDLSSVFAFAAARSFNRHPVKRHRLIIGVLLWIGLKLTVGIYGPEQDAAALGTGIAATLYAIAAYEYWLHRSERLRARYAMITIISLNSMAIYLLTIEFLSTRTFSSGLPPLGWAGGIHFVGLAYALGVSFFLISMLSERREQTYRAAALTDPLTGLPNRRAFLDRAQRALDRAENDETSVALLAFDLDRFKRINDTFGHAIGDKVLQVFTDVLTGSLRPTDIAARIGGEEFVAMLPGADQETAVAAADRIREAFQHAACLLDDVSIRATVSIGVATVQATTNDPPHALADLLKAADVALYRAKWAGRNCVLLAGEATDREPTALT